MELELGGERKMAAKTPKPINLHLESYESYFHSPHSNQLTNPQLNQIIHMHGFFMLKRPRAELLQALSEVDELLKPHRSTINESLPPPDSGYSGLTIDEVNTDLDALRWQEAPVQSLQSLFPSKNDGRFEVDGGNECSQLKKRRGRKAKPKERKVFDAIHLTRPRSRKRVQKRKHLDDIGNGNGNGSYVCLGGSS